MSGDARGAARSAGERLLARLSRSLARERRADVVVRAAVDALVAELGASIAAVFLFDEATNTVRPDYSVNYPSDVLARLEGVSVTTPALSNLALQTGEVRTASLSGAPSSDMAFTRQLGEQMRVHAAAAVPLLAGGRRLGVLVYGLAEDHAFDADEVDLLQEVGDRVAAALERARLEEELTRRAEEAELLQSILVGASGEDDLGRILSGALGRLRGLVNFSGGSIALVEDDELVVRASVGPLASEAAGQRLPRGRGRAWQVIGSGEPFLNADLAADGYRGLNDADGRALRSYLAVPLIWRGKPFGLLEIDALEPDQFDADDLRLMRSVATALSGPIELARRYAAEVALARELDSARGQLEAILTHAPMGLYFFDADHRLAWVNQSSLGSSSPLPSGEFQLNRPWDELVAEMLARRWAGTPDELAAIQRETRALRSGILEHDYPLRNPRRMLRRIAAPVFQSGAFSGHVVILLDVTEERDALARAEAAVAARERFMSIASHELKTPLTAIRAAGQLLQRICQAEPHAIDRERVFRQLLTIGAQTERLRTLVDELLDIARVQSGRLTLQRAPVELTAIVDRAIAALPEAERARVPFHYAAPIAGHWDAIRIEQVAANLLTNALKYSPSDAPVDVRVERQGEAAVMTVVDYGIGIPAEDLPTLFDPFSRGRNAPAHDRAGLGLGLFITRQIVESHGGTIAVESTVGKGSAFTVRLPDGSPTFPSPRGEGI